MNPETQFREGLDELAEHYKSVLTLLGEDADREGLQKTPMRVAKAMAYIPNGHITGLSKIARVVDIFSHRLQVQERLTLQVQECIQETLKPLGTMVVCEARHMCMMMRGVEKQNSITTTSSFSGAFNQAKTREEFMNLLRSETKRI